MHYETGLVSVDLGKMRSINTIMDGISQITKLSTVATVVKKLRKH